MTYFQRSAGVLLSGPVFILGWIIATLALAAYLVAWPFILAIQLFVALGSWVQQKEDA